MAIDENEARYQQLLQMVWLWWWSTWLQLLLLLRTTTTTFVSTEWERIGGRLPNGNEILICGGWKLSTHKARYKMLLNFYLGWLSNIYSHQLMLCVCACVCVFFCTLDYDNYRKYTHLIHTFNEIKGAFWINKILFDSLSIYDYYNNTAGWYGVPPYDIAIFSFSLFLLSIDFWFLPRWFDISF